MHHERPGPLGLHPGLKQSCKCGPRPGTASNPDGLSSTISRSSQYTVVYGSIVDAIHASFSWIRSPVSQYIPPSPSLFRL